jgi:hypothetical protein
LIEGTCIRSLASPWEWGLGMGTVGTGNGDRETVTYPYARPCPTIVALRRNRFQRLEAVAARSWRRGAGRRSARFPR